MFWHFLVPWVFLCLARILDAWLTIFQARSSNISFKIVVPCNWYCHVLCLTTPYQAQPCFTLPFCADSLTISHTFYALPFRNMTFLLAQCQTLPRSILPYLTLTMTWHAMPQTNHYHLKYGTACCFAISDFKFH